MRTLVTGASGCVGMSLKNEVMKSEHEWVFVGSKDCDLRIRTDTLKLFEQTKPDYVVHLASYVPGFYNMDKVKSFSDNVKMNENVLEASYLSDVKKGIFALSINMFSDNPSKLPIDESMMFEGELNSVVEGYGYSKRMLALQCKNYNEQYNRKYIGIIPCNIYGPHDNLNSGRLIPNLIKKFYEAKQNKTDVIINGTGKPYRQFIYSADLSNIIVKLLFSYKETKPIICGGDVEINIIELANKIGQHMNFKGQIIFDTSKKDGCLKRTVSNAYLLSLVPGLSFTPFDVGLSDTITALYPHCI